jgi:hypothetical protein
MVGADDDVAIAAAVIEQGRAAMAAGIGEGADHLVLAAHDDERHAGEFQRHIVTGIRNLVDMTQEVPRLAPDALDFALVEIVRGVAPGRQRHGLQQRLADRGIVGRIE